MSDETITLTEKIVNETFAKFNTPLWGITLVINNIEKFTDAELITMRVFILDEIEKRKIAKRIEAIESAQEPQP